MRMSRASLAYFSASLALSIKNWRLNKNLNFVFECPRWKECFSRDNISLIRTAGDLYRLSGEKKKKKKRYTQLVSPAADDEEEASNVLF